MAVKKEYKQEWLIKFTIDGNRPICIKFNLPTKEAAWEYAKRNNLKNVEIKSYERRIQQDEMSKVW